MDPTDTSGASSQTWHSECAAVRAAGHAIAAWHLGLVYDRIELLRRPQPEPSDLVVHEEEGGVYVLRLQGAGRTCERRRACPANASTRDANSIGCLARDTHADERSEQFIALIDVLCRVAGHLAEARHRQISVDTPLAYDALLGELVAALGEQASPSFWMQFCVVRAREISRIDGVWPATIVISGNLQRRGALSWGELNALMEYYTDVGEHEAMLDGEGLSTKIARRWLRGAPT